MRNFIIAGSIAVWLGVLGLAAMVPLAHASAPHLTRSDCPLPVGYVPWRYAPSGCYVVPSGASATLPRSATEVDVWSANGRTHLVQRSAHYAGSDVCPQWGFSARGYAVGWVTCNRDIFNYGRAVIAYYWRG